jgi:glyoxylase-like metal-dependent hydrolase (beta-lactamase superfamily II)
VRELVSGIFTWSWFSERHGYNFNGHLVRHAEGDLCIDPVEPTAEALAEIIASRVAHVVITNRNHVRAANLVRTRTGAQTLIDRRDANHARRQGAQIDAHLEPGNRLGPFVVVGVPGKSAGEIALHWPEHRILLVGDAIIGNPPGHCSLLSPQVIDDLPGLRASVRRLLDLDFDTLLVGDGVPIIEGAKERLQALVQTFPDA